MTQYIPRSLSHIRIALNEHRHFHAEEDVESRNWRIPTGVYDTLKDYTIGEYGTTHHMGAVITKAILADLHPDYIDHHHQTWQHLKSSYDWNHINTSVEQWTYKVHYDYSNLPNEETTQLHFSCPRSILNSFIKNAEDGTYGERLANVIESELRKRYQIQRMQALIADGVPAKTEVETIEVENDAAPAMQDITATIEFVDGLEPVGWQARRGYLAAHLRTRDNTPRKYIYNVSELLGAESTRSQRKDLKKLLEYANTTECEPLAAAPGYKVSQTIGYHTNSQSAGLTSADQFVENYGDEYNFAVIDATLTTLTPEDAWTEFLDETFENAVTMIEVNWQVPDSVQHVYNGMRQWRCLNKYVEYVEAIGETLKAENDLDNHDILLSRINSTIKYLTGEMDAITPKQGTADIREAYKDFKDKGKWPSKKNYADSSNHSKPQPFIF